MPSLDQRLHAYRDDLADERLRGKIDHRGEFVTPKLGRINLPLVDQFSEARAGQSVINQLLLGEPVWVFPENSTQNASWAWVQSRRDHYVGYVQSSAIAPEFDSTHFVDQAGSILLEAPEVKAPTREILPMLAEVKVLRQQGDFSETPLGWIPSKHLCPINNPPPLNVPTLIQLAQEFVGSPYLWGGKSRLGLDCSGLLQLLFRRFACPLPRDTDMQQSCPELQDNDQAIQAGDVIFWPGHVGIMVDQQHLLHANAFAMRTCIEPLDEACARILATANHHSRRKRWVGA